MKKLVKVYKKEKEKNGYHILFFQYNSKYEYSKIIYIYIYIYKDKYCNSKMTFIVYAMELCLLLELQLC